MKAASFIKIAFFINKSKRDLRVKVCCATVEVLHRTSKWGEVRLRRTMVSFNGMFTLVHPFATTWHFPSRGNEKFRGAFLLPPHRTAGGKVVRSTKGGDGASRQTIDDRRGRDLRFEV